MKRFTETSKWSDPWFRKLSPELKNLWQWLTDNCDNAGVIEVDLDLASFQIGYQYPINTLSEFGDRVQILPCGKHFIPKFIPFQYGQLSEECKAHKPVFASLEKHGIKGYPKGIDTLQEKEKEKEKETDKEPPPKSRGTEAEFSGFAVEIGLQPDDGIYLFNHLKENGWMRGKVPIKDWKATARKWKAGNFFPSQKNPQPKPSNPLAPGSW